MRTWAPLRAMLRDWFTSKKVLTALITAACSFINHDIWRNRIQAVGGLLLLVQGLNDIGKAKAEVDAAASTTKECPPP